MNTNNHTSYGKYEHLRGTTICRSVASSTPSRVLLERDLESPATLRWTPKQSLRSV